MLLYPAQGDLEKRKFCGPFIGNKWHRFGNFIAWPIKTIHNVKWRERTEIVIIIIIIIIMITKLQFGWHPVAVVHIYTQTVHRIQRTEQT
jgi:hypothetical protein